MSNIISIAPVFANTDAISIAKVRAAANKKVSDKYQTFDTESLITRMTSVLQSEGHVIASVNTRLRVSRVNAKSSDHATTVTLGGMQKVNGLLPNFTLRNSFNGEGSLEFSFGTFRLICTNGLSIGNHIAPPIRIKHVQGELADDFLRRFDTIVREAAQLAIQYTTVLHSRYSSIPVFSVTSQRDAFLTFLRQEGHISEQQQRIAVGKYVAAYDRNEESAWGSFNAAQEALMTDTRGRRRTTGAAADRNSLLSKHFDTFLGLNQKAA
jgi:hypothetical protein